MATTNTSYNYFWYIRKKGRNWYLGLIDNEGAAIATADLDIDIYYDALPAEITSKDDDLPIPRDAEDGFAMGCVYKLLLALGIERDTYNEMYERTVYETRHRQTQEVEDPAIIKPLNMREN